VDLEAFKRTKGGDDAQWVCCPVCDGSEFAVVARFAGDKPFVAYIVCPSEACAGNEGIPIVGGFLGVIGVGGVI
jgi:hypothetical protein